MPKTILIVDENYETKKLKEGVFRFCNFSVKSTADGHEALEMAKQGGIDIVLSDNPMTEIKGEEFVQQLKSSQTTKYIPIVMLASSNKKVEQKKMQAKGVSEYIVKPFNVEHLIKKVRELTNYQDALYTSN